MMTEQQWLQSADPRPLWAFLGEQGNGRKWRLFAVACCRRIWPCLKRRWPDQAMIEAAERCADGKMAWQAILDTFGQIPLEQFNQDQLPRYLAACAAVNVQEAEGKIAAQAARIAAGGDPQEFAAQADLLRDIFGNPFRRVVLDSSWLTPAVRSLAEAAYEDRSLPSGTLNLDRLAVLADALLDAGCTDPDLLAHLRGPGPHVRGCHLLDLLTQRY